MKLDASEFIVENEILTANECGIVYDNPRPKIEEVWDRLASYYIDKTALENRSEIAESEFYNFLAHSRVENETAVAVYDLCSRNVLRTYESHEYKEERANIKKRIVEELGTILDRRLQELGGNIEEENSLFQKIKTYKYEVKIFQSQLQIYTDALNYVEFGTESYGIATATGLSCKIKLREVELSGFYRRSTSNPFEEQKISLLESKLLGKYEKFGITVLILRDKTEAANEVCVGLLAELLYGRGIDDLFLQLSVFISRFCLRRITEGCTEKELIETETDTLCDNVSSIFYVKTEDSIIKIDRSNNDMEIFINGFPVNIKINE